MIHLELKDDGVAQAMTRVAAALADPTPLMQELGEVLLESTKARFKTGTGPDGTAWAPKAESTLAAYRARKDRADPRPLIGPSRALSSTIAVFASAEGVEVGSNLVYAAVMQFGAGQGEFGAFVGKDRRGRDHSHPIPWGDIPARPFLGVSDEDRTNILAAVDDWLGRLAQGRS